MTKMPWPVVPIKWCDHLKGKKPSQVSLTMLRPITGGGQLHHCAARAWEAMKHAAMAEGGINLKPTSSGDTYRSIAQQKAGFLQRFQKEPIEGAQTRTYEGAKWYLKKGMAVLASPVDDPAKCSRHMMGIAVDVANASGKVLAWLLENEQRFGFSHEVVEMPGAEPWHLRFTEGQAMPQAVLDYEAANLTLGA
jgi:LAS superfamily LD-carboxypeptidase LdcB